MRLTRLGFLGVVPVLALVACSGADSDSIPRTLNMSLSGDGTTVKLVNAPADGTYMAKYPIANVQAMAVTIGADGNLTALCSNGSGLVDCGDNPFFSKVSALGNGRSHVRIVDVFGRTVASTTLCEPSGDGSNCKGSTAGAGPNGGGNAGAGQNGSGSGGGTGSGSNGGGTNGAGGNGSGSGGGTGSGGGNGDGSGGGTGSGGNPAGGTGAGGTGSGGGTGNGGTGDGSGGGTGNGGNPAGGTGAGGTGSGGGTGNGGTGDGSGGGTGNGGNPGGGTGNGGNPGGGTGNGGNPGGGTGNGGSNNPHCNPDSINAIQAQFCSDIDAWLTSHNINFKVDCSKLDIEVNYATVKTPPNAQDYACRDIIRDGFKKAQAKVQGCPMDAKIEVNNWDSSSRYELRSNGACRRSPLVIDLDGDGVNLTSLENGVSFDMFGTGEMVHTAWINKNDGWLVLDRNNNGKIDSGAEFFGDSETNADGFTALAELDENNDGRIDSKDSAFKSLRVWRDINSDGVSSPSELLTLEEAKISALLTKPQHHEGVASWDLNGNQTPLVGQFIGTNGKSGMVVDAYLRFKPMK